MNHEGAFILLPITVEEKVVTTIKEVTCNWFHGINFDNSHKTIKIQKLRIIRCGADLMGPYKSNFKTEN